LEKDRGSTDKNLDCRVVTPFTHTTIVTVTMRALALTAAALLAATPLASGDPSFWLSKNHAAFEWRKMVGAPMANNDMRKVVHWVRQEQVC